MGNSMIRLCLHFVSWFDSSSGPRPPHCRRFDIILRHYKLGRTPLDEWSDRRRNLYLKTHNKHKRQISIMPVDSNPQPQ